MPRCPAGVASSLCVTGRALTFCCSTVACRRRMVSFSPASSGPAGGGERVLILCGHGGDCLDPAVAAGADGLLLKEADHEEVRFAVRSVLAGGFFVSPSVAGRLATRCRQGWALEDRRTGGWEALTPREREVLHYVAEGFRNREIADLLVVSEKTVEKHRANFMAKLGLHSAAEVRAFAQRQGLPLRLRDHLVEKG